MAVTLPGQMPYKSTGMASEFDAALNAAVRKKKLAEMLQQQALSPLDDVASRTPGAKMSWTQPLGKMAQMLAGIYAGKGADEEEATANAARDAGFADAVKNLSRDTPEVPGMPIEQEAVAKPPLLPQPPPGAPPPAAAAFGPQGMPNVGPRDNELTGSGSPMAALLAGGAPPPANPLAPPPVPGADAGPAFLPKQPLDMAGPGMLPKLSTDMIPAKVVSPEQRIAEAAGLNKFGPAGQDLAKQLTASAVKGMTPMTPAETAELAMKHQLAKEALAQKSEALKAQMEDRNLTREQQATLKREHDQVLLQMKQMGVDTARAVAGAAQGEKGNMPVEGASLAGNPVVRNTKSGIAHEVINGVPSKEPYAGTITPKVEQAKAVASASKGAQGIKDMEDILEKTKGDTKIFGGRAIAGALTPPIGDLPNKVAGLSDEQQATRSQVAAMTAETTHSMYGTAFSANEAKQAKSYLINPTDGPERVRQKLEGRLALEKSHLANLPESARNAATARQGGASAAPAGQGWGKAEKQ